MFCRKCGRMIADDAVFCSYCGTPTAAEPVAPDVPEEPLEPVAEVPEVPEVEPTPIPAEPDVTVARKPIFDEFQWNVNDYPDNNSVAKTEDIDFDWNADPNEIRDRYSEQRTEPAGLEIDEIVPGGTAPAPAEEPEYENMSASDRIDKFYTFNRKNEEFQELLNREYQKVKAGSAISYEQSEADSLAEEKFEHREPDTSMDAFLRREGVEKPYEPKPFESDVLARIEAAEEAREMKRREEEARQAALEQARKEAEEKMKLEEEARAKAAEEARIKAEEEAKIRAEEEARIRAEEAFKEAERLKEEARIRAEEVAKFKAEEEARAKAEEEARLQAEEEARLKAEEEARLQAEEEARIKAEEEAARLAEEQAAEAARIKAEADRRAAMEAEKIKAQREARMAAEAAEREKAEAERRKEEEARLRARLEEEQASLARRADNAAVEQEARKVLEQTAKMREAEAAKIRAAIAGIKGELAAKPLVEEEPEAPAEPEKPAEPEVPVEPAKPAEPEVPVEPAKPVEPEAPVVPERPAEPERPSFVSRQTVVPEPVQFADTVAIQRGDEEIAKAQQATRDRITKMAQARESFFAGFEPEEKERTPIQPPIEKPAPQPVETPEERPTTGRNTMLSSGDDLTRTRAIDKSAILAGMEKTRRLQKAELNAKEDKEFFESLAEKEVPIPAEPEPLEVKEPEQTVEDLLSQFETANNVAEEEPAVVIAAEIAETPEEVAEAPAEAVEVVEAAEEAVEAPAEVTEELVEEQAEAPAELIEETAEAVAEPVEIIAEDIPEEGFAKKEEPTLVPDAKASEEIKPGLEDTMIMPESELAKNDLMSDFDSYGEEEAARLRAQQEAEAQVALAQKEAEEAAAEEQPEKGGKGKAVLKVILVLLIIIFAIELAGIGIKFLAPQSQAAETIDNQLNKIIHLITGEETTSDDIMIV